MKTNSFLNSIKTKLNSIKTKLFGDNIKQKQLYESGNWYTFGRGDRWIGPDETWEEAEDCIVREYCEATGHWDLFIWKEVEE